MAERSSRSVRKNSVAIASNDSYSGWTSHIHRSTFVRRNCRPTHLRRQHHRDRHRFLPPRPHQSQQSQIADSPTIDSSSPRLGWLCQLVLSPSDDVINHP